MHRLFLCWIAAVHSVAAIPHHLQFSVPRTMMSNSVSDDDDVIHTQRLRHALRALLELDDDQIYSLLVNHDGASEDPRQSMFLRASKNRLQRLQTMISRDDPPLVTEDRDDVDEGDVSLEADTLLHALDDMSHSLGKRSRRKTKKHKKHSTYSTEETHSSRKETHFSYWLRSGDCPKTVDGSQKSFCPSPTKSGKWICVDEQELCDGHSHCPGNEDEDPKACLFYKSVHNYLELLTTTILRSRRY